MGREKGKGARRGVQGASAAGAAHRVASSGSGKTFVGFGGFSGSVAIGQAADASSAAISPADSPSQRRPRKEKETYAQDYRLSGEVAAILKGLKKREPVTKVKALQAFRAYVNADPSQEDATVGPGSTKDAVLGAWSYYYPRLAVDNNRQVRMEAAGAHWDLLRRSDKGSLQQHLPRFFPQWLRSRHDENREVARICAESVSAVLPDAVLSKATAHYLAQILQRLCKDVCAKETSFGDSAVESSEEIRGRRDRAVTTSLRCMADCLEGGSPSGLGAAEVECLAGIMGEGEEFGRRVLGSANPSVRQAAYNFLGRAALSCPEVLAGCPARLARQVVGCFAERDRGCCRPVLEMAIAVNKGAAGVWGGVDPAKAFWPPFHDFLRSGCRGDGLGAYNAILPLLSTLPPQAWEGAAGGGEESLEILLRTLRCLLEGAAGNAQIAQAGGACFAECLLYFVFKAQDLAGACLGEGRYGSVAELEGSLLEQALAQVFIPLVLEGGDGSPGLARLGQAAFAGVLGTLEQGASERSARLQYLACGVLRDYVLGQFSAGSAREAFLVNFLCGLEPRGRISGPVVAPLAASLIGEARRGDEEDAAVKYLATLVDTFGEHLVALDGGGEGSLPSVLTGFCVGVSTDDAASPSFCRLFMSWLGHSEDLRGRWPSILAEVNEGGGSLKNIGARLLEHIGLAEGLRPCQELDDLLVSLAAEDFVKSSRELALGAFEAVLLSTRESGSPVSHEAVARILQRMKFMVVERLIGCPREMSLGDDLHGVIRTTMQRAGSEFPKRLIAALTDLVSSAICLLSVGVYFASENEEVGAGASDLGFDPSTLSSLDGIQMASAFREFASEWSPRGRPAEDFQRFFGGHICKIIDAFEDSTIADQVSVLIKPAATWPVWVDPKTGNVASAGGAVRSSKPGYYGAFLLSFMTCAQNYDLICRASQENAWLPLELMSACIAAGFAGVTEAEVFKYICILEENTQREEDSTLEWLFERLRQNLLADLDGQDFFEISFGDTVSFRNMSLLLHFMSDLCPLKLFDLLNRHVIEGAAALVSEVGDLGEACLLNLTVLHRIGLEILERIRECGSDAPLSGSGLRKIADSIAPSTHLSRKGVTSDALLHRKIQASVLAAQIVGDVLGFGLLGGIDAKEVGESILSKHFSPLLEPMLAALSPLGEDAPDQCASSTGPALVHRLAKVQTQVLRVVLELSPTLEAPSVVSMSVVHRNLRVTLTRLAALFEDAAEGCLGDTGLAEFQSATDASESALSLVGLLLAHQSRHPMSRHVSAEEKEVLLGSCLRVVFSAAAIHVGIGSSSSILQRLSYNRGFFQSLLDVIKHAPRTCLLEALEEANAWEPLQQSKGTVPTLLGAFLSLPAVSGARTCVGHVLSTRSVCLPLLASPREEDLNGLYEAEEADGGAVSYALAKLGMSEILAENIFRSGGGTTLEARIRSWALFSSYLRTLGRGPLNYVCALLRQTDAVSGLLSILVAHLPTPGRRAKATASPEDVVSLRDVVTNSRYLGEEDYVTRGAAAVYRSLLHLMPASVGSWFTEIKNRQMISDIEKYTSVNETPRLIGLELETISSRGDLEVVALHNKSQVVTRYRKDDSTLELVIKLPGSFPLRPVEVEFTSTFGFGEAVLRKWLLSMRSFLRNQDGTIDDAIYMWYQNVEKQFEGVEECPICYSIIQPSDHTLPKLKCRTCGNKFHSSCMFKWFSQGKATCPMCRSLW